MFNDLRRPRMCLPCLHVLGSMLAVLLVQALLECDLYTAYSAELLSIQCEIYLQSSNSKRVVQPERPMDCPGLHKTILYHTHDRSVCLDTVKYKPIGPPAQALYSSLTSLYGACPGGSIGFSVRYERELLGI